MTKTETISFRSFMDQSYKKKAHKETNSKNVLGLVTGLLL